MTTTLANEVLLIEGTCSKLDRGPGYSRKASYLRNFLSCPCQLPLDGLSFSNWTWNSRQPGFGYEDKSV